MTDRQELERLIAMVKQSREAQRTYFKHRKSASQSHAKTLLDDARFKENAVDNLINQLERKGYQANKNEGVNEQTKMF